MYFTKNEDVNFHRLLSNISKKLFIGSNFFLYDEKKIKVVNFGDVSPDFKSEWINSILSFNGEKKTLNVGQISLLKTKIIN